MKALILKEYNLFSYENVETPHPADDEVLIRVHACAICGSDVHGMDGSTGRRIPPVVMGHEASGVIEMLGKAVTDFAVGERVTFDSTVSCGDCFYCRRGEINLCDNRRVLGVSCSEYNFPGAFAEYVVVPRRILYRIPSQVSFLHAAMVEPLSIALHALERTKVSLGDIAVVVGAGMIGSLLIQLLRAAGCSHIIAVDLVQERLELASRLGADTILKSDEVDVQNEVLRLTNGRGVDLAYEVVGITPTLMTAIATLRKGGSLVLVGNLSQLSEFPLQSVVTKQLTLFGSCSSAGEYPRCLEWISSGRIDIESFISVVAPLSEGAAWFRKLQAGKPGLMKVILQP